MTNDDLETIYVLENAAMPGYLKIGRTRDLISRIATLSAELPLRALAAT